MGQEVAATRETPFIPYTDIFASSEQIITAQSADKIIDALMACFTSSDSMYETVIFSPYIQELSQIRPSRYWRSDDLAHLPGGPLLSLDSTTALSPGPITTYYLANNLSSDPSLPEYLHDLAITVGFDQLVILAIGYNDTTFGFLQIIPRGSCTVKSVDIDPIAMLCSQAGMAFWQIQQERERLALDALNHDLNHAVTQEDAGETVVEILANYSQTDNARLFLIDANTQSARLLVEHKPTFSDFEGSSSWDDPLIFQFSHTQEPIVIEINAPGEFQAAADRYLAPFNYKTSLVVPIFNQLILNGFVILDSRQPNFVFTPEVVKFTKKIAKQFEIRYENLLLYDEAFKRAQELIQLNQFGERLSSTLVPQELVNIVYESTQQLFDAPIFMLGLIDDENELIQPILYRSTQRHLQVKPSRVLAQSSISAQIRSQETTICWQSDPLLLELYELLHIDGGSAPATGIFAPIIQNGFGHGFIAILAFEPDIYKPDHIQLIRSIANQTGLCLSNSNLLKQSENHISELRSLFNVTQALANGISADERITNSLRTLHLSLEQSKVAVILLDKELEIQSLAFDGYSDEDLDELKERIIRNSLLDEPVVGGLRPSSSNLISSDSSPDRYELVVPFALSSGEIGGLIIENQQAEIINTQTLRLLQTLSVSFAATLENGQLFEQIEEANEQLRELDRLKTQFLANMSHELRTPLNSIIGFSKLILRGIDGPITKAQEDDLTSIYHSGQLLLKLINDILDLTKLEAGKMPMSFEEVDLKPLAEKALLTTRGLIREEFVRLILDIEPHLPHIEADPLRIRQIMLNLLSNAAKFTTTGSITLRMVTDPTDDTHVVLSVIDTGTGIAQEDLPKLFELFEQGRHARMIGASGTGLGLPIVKELVQLHNGDIDVDSTLDIGTTFFIKLPFVQPEMENDLVDEPEPVYPSYQPKPVADGAEFNSNPLMPISTDPNGNHPAILLVDDEPSVLKLYQRYLSNQPNEILCAVNGLEALSLLRRRGNDIGLVLLDIHMPGLTGWDVLAEMRNVDTLSEIPVAICSLDVDPRKALASGAQMVLHKPIISEDLTKVLALAKSRQN